MTGFNDATEVRAVIEGQCLAKRLYAERLGCSMGMERLIKKNLTEYLIHSKLFKELNIH